MFSIKNVNNLRVLDSIFIQTDNISQKKGQSTSFPLLFKRLMDNYLDTECCFGRGSNFCTAVNGCLDISDSGDSDLFLNQRGNFVAVSGGGGSLTTEKFTLSSAQILNSNTSSIELIPAPGPGKYINILSIYYVYNFVSVPYTVPGIIVGLRYGTAAAIPGSITINSASDTNGISVINGGNVGAILNTNINFFAATTNPLNGDGDLTIYITYTIVTA